MMQDLTMCASTDCLRQWECHRAMAKPQIMQSYFDFNKPDQECKDFWPIAEEEKE